MTNKFSSALQTILRAFAAVLAIAGLAACGGGVSPAQNVPDQQVIVILPASTAAAPVTVYSGLPTTFSITGGNGSYIVASDNHAIIASPGSFAGSSFTLVPNAVSADTTITLTARDTGTSPPVAATVTVRNGTVNNEITIIPTSTQGGGCAPAVCSGGDAQVTATLSQGGAPLTGRTVRFEATSGDYRFIITAPNTGVETFELSTTAVTDSTGKARVRLRVNAGAANQTALLKVTDLATGSFQQTSFVIAQVDINTPSPGYFVIPASVTFTGPRVDQCARNVSSNFFVYGGRPPYTISNTSTAFSVTPTTVGAAGGSFAVSALGGCVDPGLPIGITDSSGRTITVTVANKLGTAEIPALVVAPETISLTDCDSIASATVAGGTGTYLQPTAGSGSVLAFITGNTISVRRLNPSPPAVSPVSIGVSDGISTKTITLNLSGRGLGACPTVAMSASPASVTLTDCSSATVVSISGGSGTYTASSSNSSVSAVVSGNSVTIRRVATSPAFSGGTITVSDGVSNIAITVGATGIGAGVCPSTPTNPLTANPTSITLSDCTTARSVTLSGGSGSYSSTTSSSALVANITGTNITIQRAIPSPASSGGTVTVTDSAGASVVITVVTAGAGAQVCTGTSTTFLATPSSVTLGDCTTAQSVVLSGGTTPYSILSNSSSSVSANIIGGSTLSIRRASASLATTGGLITLQDSGSPTPASLTVAVNTSGAGASNCP